MQYPGIGVSLPGTLYIHIILHRDHSYAGAIFPGSVALFKLHSHHEKQKCVYTVSPLKLAVLLGAWKNYTYMYLCCYARVDQRHRQVLYQRYIRAGLRYIRGG